jgi:hypothetical protein
MDTLKPPDAATATAVADRSGQTETTDGIMRLNLSVPKEIGIIAMHARSQLPELDPSAHAYQTSTQTAGNGLIPEHPW